VLHSAIARGQPGADFVGIVIKRAHPAAIRDAAGFVDDVEALWPGGVSVVGGVVYVVNAEGDGVMESLNEIVGDGYALGESFRLGVADIIFHIRLHLPLVGGMSFAHVHRQKIGVIFVVIVNLHHVTDVAAERRSSVAAEDDDERSRASAFANVEMISTVERKKARVGGVVADFESAAMHVGQGIAQHTVGIFRASGHLAEEYERNEQEHQKNANGPFPKDSHRKFFRSLSDAAACNLV